MHRPPDEKLFQDHGRFKDHTELKVHLIDLQPYLPFCFLFLELFGSLIYKSKVKKRFLWFKVSLIC